MGKVCSSRLNRTAEETDAPPTAQKVSWLLAALERAQIMNFFTDPQKQALVKSMQLLTIDPGETIITHKSKENQHLYVIESGEVEVYIFDKLVRTLRAGDNFGELAFAFGCTRSATCKMKETGDGGVLWVLDHETFQKTIHHSLKDEGLFKIVRQPVDMAHHEQYDHDQSSDMEILEQAGMREKVMEDHHTMPRMLPTSFIRRVSEQKYKDPPSLVERNLALFQTNILSDGDCDDNWFHALDPDARIVE